jgi:hypothetical protein
MAENNDTNQLNDEASPKDDEEDIIELTNIVSDTEDMGDIELPDYTDEAISVSEEEKVTELDDDILDNIVKLEDDLNKDIEIDHYLDDEFVDSADLGLELYDSEDKKQDISLEPEEEADNLEQLIAEVVEDTQQKTAHEKETASDDTTEPVPLSPEQVDEALERVIKKMYADKIDSILTEVIEKTVTKEIERLKALL